MTTLHHLEASYTDVYALDVLFDALNDHPPVRATRITVHTDHVSDPESSPHARIRVTVTGDRLHKRPDGTWVEAGPAGRAYGLGEDPVRYGVCHKAVLDALARHGLRGEDVVGFGFVEPWETHVATLDASTADLSAAHVHQEDDD